MFVDYINHEKNDYVQAIKQCLQEYDGIIIYGAGKMGRCLFHLLRNVKIQAECFCVTDTAINNKEVLGMPVYSYAYCLKHKKNYLYLPAIKSSVDKTMMQANLLRDGLKYISVPKYIAPILDPVFFRPILEVTTKIGCKVNCHYCPQDKFVSKYRNTVGQNSMSPFEMTLDTFKQYIDKVPQNAIIDFGGFVEPCTNQQIVDLMKYAVSTGRDVELYTTLVGLNVEKLHEILKLPLYRVVLHLPDKDKFAQIPLTQEYLKMLDLILDAKRVDGRPFIDNANCQSQLDPIVKNILRGRITVNSEVMTDRAGNLSFTELRSATYLRGKIYCEWSGMQNHNILLPDGRLLLCCMDWGMCHVLGDLSVDDYETIMESTEKKRISLAMQANDDSFNVLCRSCTDARIWEENVGR